MSRFSRRIVVVYKVDTTFTTIFKAPVTTTIFTVRITDIKMVCCTTLLPYIVTTVVTTRFTAKVKVSPRAFPMRSVPKLAIRAKLGVTLVTIKYKVLDVLFYVLLGVMKRLCAGCLGGPCVEVMITTKIVVLVAVYLGAGSCVKTKDKLVTETVRGNRTKPLSFL